MMPTTETKCLEEIVNRVVMFAALVLLATTMCLGQDPSAMSSSGAPAAASGSALHGTIPATLAKSIDSKKLKDGDEIDAKTISMMRTADGVMIPPGSKIIGRVTEAKARSKGDPDSTLGISFDKIQLSGGKELPIKGVLQAVGPNPTEGSGPDTGAASAGTMAKGGAGGSATMASPVSSPGGNAGGQNGQQGGGGKMLGPQSSGVVGIRNLSLEDAVLRSTGKEVKLDMGSQLMIKAE
jgi:hypothetical protein